MESEIDKERIEPAAMERKQRLKEEKKKKEKKHEGENLQYRQICNLISFLHGAAVCFV